MHGYDARLHFIRTHKAIKQYYSVLLLDSSRVKSKRTLKAELKPKKALANMYSFPSILGSKANFKESFNFNVNIYLWMIGKYVLSKRWLVVTWIPLQSL